MAYSWKVLSAAVEQRVWFPHEDVLNEYMTSCGLRGDPLQVLSVEVEDDGSCVALIRKKYNNNLFLSVD